MCSENEVRIHGITKADIFGLGTFIFPILIQDNDGQQISGRQNYPGVEHAFLVLAQKAITLILTEKKNNKRRVT